jgi:hypothetical protein
MLSTVIASLVCTLDLCFETSNLDLCTVVCWMWGGRAPLTRSCRERWPGLSGSAASK